METGEILKNVWMALGYKNKSSFARSLGRRVEIIDYASEKNRISDILEMLIISKHPVNAEYLRTGKEPILKVEYRASECPMCNKKDEQIEHLLEEIEIYKEYIQRLKDDAKSKKLDQAG